MKNILLVAGTRPNFIKLAPLYHRLCEEVDFIRPFICHTGQHFDFNMSDVFWQNLKLPAPDFQLNVKGNSVVDTIAKTMLGINEVVQRQAFDLVIVFGDVNATAAGAIVGAQSRIPVMHVESGLRSYDRDMPEEINRVITDHVSDYLMVSEASGVKNLEREGFAPHQIQMVGNIMIECLLKKRSHWENIELPGRVDAFYRKHPLVATFHRPENVDTPGNMSRIVDILLNFSRTFPVVFPVHPRTFSRLEKGNLLEKLSKESSILITEPLSYFEFLKLVSNANIVITDSGGVQEETSYLNIPCATFRKNTERPITVDSGTNLMVSIWDDDYLQKINRHIETIKNRPGSVLPLWDGEVSTRIVRFIKETVFS